MEQLGNRDMFGSLKSKMKVMIYLREESMIKQLMSISRHYVVLISESRHRIKRSKSIKN